MTFRTDPLVRRLRMRYMPRIQKHFALAEAWVFGSRARGDAMEESDLDVLLVSTSFEGVPWPDRAGRVLLAARVTDPLELLCYTPAEFRSKRRELGIVQAAVTEGKRIRFKTGPSRRHAKRA